METYTEIIESIDNNIIRGTFISVLLIVFVQKFFKRLDTQTAITIIKWLLISYATAIVLRYLLSFLFSENSNNSVFLSRVTGSYKFAYWLMLIAQTLPFLLLFKKLSDKIYFILFVTIAMNVGWLFESFMSHVLSIRRDYPNQIHSYDAYLPYNQELIIIIKGIILAIITIIIGNFNFLNKKIIKN